jgi:hypothetical protein
MKQKIHLAVGMAQVEQLPNKIKALSSKPSTARKRLI